MDSRQATAAASAQPDSAGPAETDDPSLGPSPSPVVDLDHYVPAYLTWIANKLSRGASQHYLALFDVGIETWRCLVLLAVQGAVSAQQVSKVIGLDKGAVSRCFKQMQARGLITLGLDDKDGRLRMATLTAEGRALHDQILQLALLREQVFLSVLDADEQATLLGLLRRLHENLPAVEQATAREVKALRARGVGRVAPAVTPDPDASAED